MNINKNSKKMMTLHIRASNQNKAKVIKIKEKHFKH